MVAQRMSAPPLRCFLTACLLVCDKSDWPTGAL